MYNFKAISDEDRDLMLKSIGLNSVEDLFSYIPDEAKVKNYDMPQALSELQAQKKLKALSNKNNVDFACFLGAGAYQKFTPAAVGDVASRFEFLSAYTPYQAEISQGSLQIMYEFQTYMCNITNQDVSNASLYDGATACAEAIFMATRINKKNKTFVDKNINPNYLEVVKTYCSGADIELIVDDLANCQFDDLDSILYQSPNYYGEIVEMPEKKGKELIIACVDISTLSLLEPPKSDITVGDFQTLGLPLSFGGPYGGFITCRDAYKRQLSGRIVGKTLDKKGDDAYVLTLQAREQHIRREKATSNICSNQALMAVCATLYLSLMGETGFREINHMAYKNAHKLALGLQNKGHKILNKEFFNEFVFELKEGNSKDYLDKLHNNGVLGGIALDDKRILACATELNDDSEIDLYLSV